MAGACDFRFNVPVPRAGEPPYAFPVDTSLTRADNSCISEVRRIWEGSATARSSCRRSACGQAAGLLFGQLGYAGAAASTSMFTRHVNPIDVSVQGPGFAAIPSQLINAPFALPSSSTVQQAAALPVLGAAPPSSVMQQVATPPQVLVPK